MTKAFTKESRCACLLALLFVVVVSCSRQEEPALADQQPAPDLPAATAAATQLESPPEPPPPTPILEPEPPSPESERAARVIAASDLTRSLATSDLRGWEITVVARGKECDVLHIQAYVNLEQDMAAGMLNGSGPIYGRAIPGGIGQVARSYGFATTVFTNPGNSLVFSNGDQRFESKRAVTRLRRCE